MDLWALGPLDPWIPGCLDPWTPVWALVPLDLWAPGPLDPWTLGPLWALGPLDPLRPDLDTTLDGPWTLGPLDPDTILDGPWTLGALEPCGPVRFEIDPLVIFGSVWVNLLKLTRNLCKFTMLVAFGPLNPWERLGLTWNEGPLPEVGQIEGRTRLAGYLLQVLAATITDEAAQDCFRAAEQWIQDEDDYAIAQMVALVVHLVLGVVSRVVLRVGGLAGSGRSPKL